MHHRSRLLLYIASCILSILFMSFTLTTTGLDQQCQVYRVHLGTGVPKYFHELLALPWDFKGQKRSYLQGVLFAIPSPATGNSSGMHSTVW